MIGSSTGSEGASEIPALSSFDGEIGVVCAEEQCSRKLPFVSYLSALGAIESNADRLSCWDPCSPVFTGQGVPR